MKQENNVNSQISAGGMECVNTAWTARTLIIMAGRLGYNAQNFTS